jgi:TubC N-terminal docking domain
MGGDVSPEALLEKLQAQGVELRTDGERIGVRPASVLTDEDRAAILHHKPRLIVLLSGPAERAVIFRQQLVAWRAEGRPGVPFFALPGIASPPGCLSCGQPTDRPYRCETCIAAVHLVLEEGAR